MKAAERIKAEDALFRRWAENSEESAAVALLVLLCRESPELRRWLWEDFARSPGARARLAAAVKDRAAPPPKAFADLTDDSGPLWKELRRLREGFSDRLYGGLTWSEVVTLIRRQQAGPLDLGAFLLARGWREAGRPTPLLLLTGAEFLNLSIPSGRRRLLKNLDRALGLLARCEAKKGRPAAYGYAAWWKLHALLYILRHPQPVYSVRELRAHLGERGLHASAKDMRRFCIRHGLRRDTRAGRPRETPTDLRRASAG